MQLIDATPIKKFIENGLNCKDPLKAFGHDAIEILTEIEFAPVVDAVEVVRCKDCKHWKPIHEHIPHMECNIFCGAYDHGYPTGADDFCSYGERRAD